MDSRAFRPLASLGLLLWALPAAAVIPSGHSILSEYADRQALDRTSPSSLAGRLTYPGRPDAPSASMTIQSPDQCQAQFNLPEGAAKLTVAHAQVGSEGSPPPAIEALVAFLCPLFAIRNVPASTAEGMLAQLARKWGVDLSVSSLNLLDGRVAYVVGARPNEPDRPQIWFEKDSYRPMRVIASRDGRLWDVRFIDPGSIGTNKLAPRITQVWEDGARVLTLRLLATDVKVPRQTEED